MKFGSSIPSAASGLWWEPSVTCVPLEMRGRLRLVILYAALVSSHTIYYPSTLAWRLGSPTLPITRPTGNHTLSGSAFKQDCLTQVLELSLDDRGVSAAARIVAGVDHIKVNDCSPDSYSPLSKLHGKGAASNGH